MKDVEQLVSATTLRMSAKVKSSSENTKATIDTLRKALDAKKEELSLERAATLQLKRQFGLSMN